MRPGRPAGRRVAIGLPAWIYLPASVGAALVVIPLAAILLQIDWRHFIPLISSESARAALLLSVKTATASTGLCVLLGVPMAITLARANFPGLRFLRGAALLAAWSSQDGIRGRGDAAAGPARRGHAGRTPGRRTRRPRYRP